MGAFRRVVNLFRRSKVEDEIAAELEAHMALRMEDNIARGMSAEDARREARLLFGNPTATRERVTAADAILGLDNLARDIRYAARQLRRSPGFALTAIFTLALGIGANVVVFGVLETLLFKPLPVPGAERLFQVEQQQEGNLTHSYPDFLDYRARNSTFADMAAFRINGVGLSTGGSAQHCWIYEASGSYFDMLGVQPELGRFFHQSDEQGPNSAPYIVLSDGFWRRRFNADPRVVGMTVDLNKHPFTIIGVAPGSFNGTELFIWPDFWMPIINEEQVEGFSFLTKRFNHGTNVIGVHNPGVTPRQATDNLMAVARQMTREHPAEDDGLTVRLVKPGLMGDLLGGPARPFLAAIMVLALLVLLAACVNLAGIFAARAADRARELAICISIGSTRWRLLRRVLMEAVLISLAGGVAGTLIAAALLGALTRWQPISEFPIHVTVVPDLRVYAIALLLTVASGLLPGLLPARQIWRTDAMHAMRSGAAPTGAIRRLTLRDVLLGVQIAVCALLVTAALVSLRGMERSLHGPMGFVPQGAVVALTDMHMGGYSDKSALLLQRRMIEEASQIPGVTAVGTVDDAPLGTGGSRSPVYREGTTDRKVSNSVLTAKFYSISPGYLAAAQTKLLAGRDFTWADGPETPQVAIVNQYFARGMFGDAQALGRHFLWTDGTSVAVVGVVEDGKYDSITEAPQAAMFFPVAQQNEADTTLVVRSALPAAQIAPALNRILRSIDASLPFTIQSWPDALALVLFPARAATAALGVMGLLAALLAVTGVFGMAAYSVSKRMRELGIRVAMGAQRSQVVRSALGRPVILLLAGSMLGLAGGIVTSRLLAFLVYEATPRDPLVLAGALLTMMLIGLAATWIPAARALRLNPARLLREE